MPAPTPTPPTPLLPQLPIGPHGRPDINPYERDIDMTAPLTFQSRTLGDIPMRLTADDRFLLDAAVFIKLMRPVLNDEAQGSLAARLQGLEQFGPDDLDRTGVQLTYDPSTLAVVVVEVNAEQRAIEDLFAPPRPDLNDISLQPEGFSAFLNLNAIQTHVWEANNHQPPTVNFDGAIRFGRFVFEGDAQIGERVGLTDNKYRFTRNYARIVFDQAEDYRRWFLGDLDTETRGLQSYVQMGGIGVLRQRRRFNAFRSAILQADRQLVLQRESTVRFMRNGTLYREMRLQPGRYDFSSLPLISGSNDIQIQVTDNSGAVQNLSYQQYLDPIDLDPGDFEYGAYLGPVSRTFDGAPDYRGQVAFSGFFRKAFFDAPAIGVGLQASKDVQTLTGQTQFVLRNGGRILLDAGASRAKSVGGGFAGGAGYEHYFDHGSTSDTLTVRGDYFSRNYATLGNVSAVNTSALTLTTQYTRMFSEKLMVSTNASFIRGRGGYGKTYRVGSTAFYRFDRKWTVRGGIDYTRYPNSGGNRNGVSFMIGLTFQPDYLRRAEARYESRDNLAEVSYNQSSQNLMNSVGFGGVAAYEDGQVRAQGYANYSANRFEATVSHATFGPNFSSFADVNATTVRMGTTIAYADGLLGIGRRINDSFMLLKPYDNLGKRSVVAGQSLAKNDYIARSGALGPAVYNFLGSYVPQSVQYDVEDAPPGYDTGAGVLRVNPPYKSGYVARIGTDAFATAMGTLELPGGKPVSLVGGRVTMLDVREGDAPKPIPFFTNSVGRFAVPSLTPGRHYLVETYGPHGTIDKAFEFTVPTDTDGLVKLGTVVPGSKN
ncbi:hypothetical protein [Sphingopyxis granuli]|uniref:hypothetical protein n=1 Tax=Sphingopyxis granuli TaxID=267128 RepID=UPI001FD01CA8|nr:hypothetical protein [Sphingopyxis granuli]